MEHQKEPLGRCLKTAVWEKMADANSPHCLASWHLFLLLPRMLFWTAPGGDNDLKSRRMRLSANTLRNRVQRFERGEWRALLEEYWAADREHAQRQRQRWHALRELTARRQRGVGLGARRGRRRAASGGGGEVEQADPAAEAERERIKQQTARCVQLCKVGEYSRAAAALFSNDAVAPPTSATADRLKQLFPQPPSAQHEPAADPAIAAFQPPAAPVVTNKILYRALMTQKRKAAGGCSGAVAEHMLELLVDKPACRTAFLPVVQALATGNVPAAVAPLLGQCRLIAISKPRDPNAVRPIAMGEWIRRLTARCLLLLHKDPIQAFFKPVQLGINTPCGVEACVKALQAHIELRPDLITIKVDIANAFNTVFRRAFFDALMSTPSLAGMLPFVRLFYHDTSTMWFSALDVEDAIAVNCAVGTQQGCTHGSLLFSMAIQPVLRWLHNTVPFAAAIADDIVFRVEADRAAAVFTELQRRLAELGSVLKLSKCEALSLSAAIPADLAGLGLKCVGPDQPAENRGTDYLGAPVGSDEFRRAYLHKLVEDTGRDLKRLGDTMRPHLQCALLLIRMCLLPRINYQLRCAPPHVTLPAAKAFDAALLDTVQTLLDTRFPPSHSAWQRVGLKLSDGGLGLTRQADVAAAAWLAACADAAELITAICPALAPVFDMDAARIRAAADAAANPAAPTSSAAAAASSADAAPTRRHIITAFASLPDASKTAYHNHQQLAAGSEDAAMPSQPPAPGGGPAAAGGGTIAPIPHDRPTGSSRLQSKLARPIHSQNMESFRASLGAAASPKDRAQYLSSCGWLGTAWLLAAPFGITDVDSDMMRVAVLTFLRLEWAEAVGVRCKCGRPLGDHSYPTDHISACDNIELTSRHHKFGEYLALLYKQLPGLNVLVREEQHIYGDDRRVDHVVSGVAGLNKNLCTDHTVVDPCVDTYVGDGAAANSSANKANRAAADSYREKNNDHNTMLQLRRLGGLYEFVAVPVEVWGGVHESFVERLEAWAKQLAEQELGHAANASEDGRRRVSLMASQILEGWRRTLSVGLVIARVKHAWSAVSGCVATAAAARGSGSLAGAGCFMQLGRSQAARLRYGVGGFRDFRRR